MTFLYPAAFLAIVVVAAPVLIHLLVHRRAERLAFPTLRFIQPTRLASMRRRMLDDVALLVVRVAILVAAIAALAAPLVVTSARQREWDARIVRAAVVARGFQPSDDVARAGAVAPAFPPTREASADRRSLGEGGQASVYRAQTFETTDLRDGVRRAVAWLDTAPPARRELVVTSPFALGSIDTAEVAAVPSSIGLRLERSGVLPDARTVASAPVLVWGGVGADPRVRPAVVARELTFAGGRTSVRETRIADRRSWPIDVEAASDAKAAIDAAIGAVLAQRVWAPPPDRRVTLFVGGRSPERLALQITTPWMAEAIARMSRDRELQIAASRTTPVSSDARLTSWTSFAGAPWQVVAVSADGTPLITAAGSSSALLVASAASAFDLVTPLMMRSIVDGMTTVSDLRRAEVVAIPDAQLRAWSRPAPASPTPRLDTLEDDQDDRRWFWAAVLGLLALEAWMRRARAATAGGEWMEGSGESIERNGESIEPVNNVA